MNLSPEAGHRPSLRGVHARGRIDGLMLDMALEQTYVNAGAEPLEVLYTFPVPLAVDVDIGGRTLAAQCCRAVGSRRPTRARQLPPLDPGSMLRILTYRQLAMVSGLLNQHVFEVNDLARLPAMFARADQPARVRLLCEIFGTDQECWQVALLILRLRCGDDALTRHVRRVFEQIEKGLNDAQRSDLQRWSPCLRSMKSMSST